MPDILPQNFGRYVLRERVGRGGMAEVFRASLPGFGGFDKIVAIKRMFREFGHDPGFVQMLTDEAKIVCQLVHPNIVQILDVGRLGDDYFIAFEFVEGVDLFAVLQRHHETESELPLGLACLIVAELCSALDHAHNRRTRNGESMGIVHRDVSPQNVLLSFLGEVKLTDFGIAKAAHRFTQTQAGLVKGKVYYMAPEQVLGHAIDHRADLFAAGILLYETLTTQPLYDEPDQKKLLEAVSRGQFRWPTDKVKRVPIALRAVVEKALRPKADERFQSGRDLRNAILAVARDVDEVRERDDLGTYLRAMYGLAPDRPPTVANSQLHHQDHDERWNSRLDVRPPPAPVDPAEGPTYRDPALPPRLPSNRVAEAPKPEPARLPTPVGPAPLRPGTVPPSQGQSGQRPASPAPAGQIRLTNPQPVVTHQPKPAALAQALPPQSGDSKTIPPTSAPTPGQIPAATAANRTTGDASQFAAPTTRPSASGPSANEGRTPPRPALRPSSLRPSSLRPSGVVPAVPVSGAGEPPPLPSDVTLPTMAAYDPDDEPTGPPLLPKPPLVPKPSSPPKTATPAGQAKVPGSSLPPKAAVTAPAQVTLPPQGLPPPPGTPVPPASPQLRGAPALLGTAPALGPSRAPGPPTLPPPLPAAVAAAKMPPLPVAGAAPPLAPPVGMPTASPAASGAPPTTTKSPQPRPALPPRPAVVPPLRPNPPVRSPSQPQLPTASPVAAAVLTPAPTPAKPPTPRPIPVATQALPLAAQHEESTRQLDTGELERRLGLAQTFEARASAEPTKATSAMGEGGLDATTKPQRGPKPRSNAPMLVTNTPARQVAVDADELPASPSLLAATALVWVVAVVLAVYATLITVRHGG